MTTAEAPREYSPDGARVRVQVNVEPEVFADLKAQACKEGRSLSNMARLMLVRGMAAHRDSRSTNAT